MADKIKVFVISNTHWDREWYLPLEKYMVRLVKLFDALIDLMEKQPQYRFVTDGQYIMLEDYLKARPKMRNRIKKLIGEGRLKVGPWYTQPLETLVTGEGMVRNLYYGMTETEKLGPPMKFGYMIDQFGHASQTPQILKGFGINDAMSWRGLENKARDVFLWSAPNGDSIFMHRSVHGYGDAVAMPESMDNFKETVDGHIFEHLGLKERIKRIKSLKDEFSPSDVQFWLNGVDHSWAQENILKIIDKINEAFPEYSAKQSSLEEYAAAVHESYRAKNIPMQKYSDEQIHPDEQILVCAHSTRADEKQRHWRAERLLEKRAEPMSALAWLMGEEYPLWALKDAWRHILENHAHDSLDCCSVDEVYERVMSRYASSISLGEQLFEDAFCYLMSMGGESDWNTLYVINTNSNTYEGVVVGEIDIPTSLLPKNIKDLGAFDIEDKSTGEKIEFATLGTEEINAVRYNAFYGHPSRIPKMRHQIMIDIGKIGGFSMKSFTLIPKERSGTKAALKPSAQSTLENEFFFVEIRPNGCIDVFDKLSKIQYSNLMQLADSGDCGSIWVHRRPKNNMIITNENAVAKITKLRQNELVTEYMVKYSLDIPEGYDCTSESRSKQNCALDVAIKISLTKKTRYIGIEIEIDNSSRFHQLRVLFCSGASGSAISMSGQPFDVVERKIGIPEGFDFDIDPNCEYHPMQDFCAVADQSRGLLVAAKGVYEYEAINDEQKTLALTLLRSTCFDLGADDNIGGYNMEKSYMLGKIKHELAIMPFAKDWREVYPHVAGYVNPPQLSFKKDPDEAVLPWYKKPDARVPEQFEFISTEGKNVYVTALKREENGDNLLVRLVSFDTKKQNVSVSINSKIPCKKSWRYSLKEEKKEQISKGNTASFEIMPKQVVTIGFEIVR